MNDARVLYFGYGSNLFPPRLEERTPSARIVGSAWPPGCRLIFHKRGADGSGKCGFVAGESRDRVFGAVYLLDPGEIPVLDRIEGAGRGYEQVWCTLEAAIGARRLFAYRSDERHCDPDLRPFDWYHGLVRAGARHHGAPSWYLERLASIATVPDLDAMRARHHRELLAASRGNGSAIPRVFNMQ